MAKVKACTPNHQLPDPIHHLRTQTAAKLTLQPLCVPSHLTPHNLEGLSFYLFFFFGGLFNVYAIAISILSKKYPKIPGQVHQYEGETNIH